MKTLYRILGIEKDATAREVKAAFRAIARDNHPDRAQARGWSKREAAEREQTFKKAQAAYAVLADPKQRQGYDSTLDAIRWSFLAARRGHKRPKQRARPDPAPPFDGINVEDVTAAVTSQAHRRRQLRLEEGRRTYQTKQAAFRAAVEKATEELLAEVMLAQMGEMGL